MFSIPRIAAPKSTPIQPWMIIALIAMGGGGIGFSQGRGWLAPALRVLLLVAAVSAVAGFAWRARRPGMLREGIAVRVQEFGGGTYGLASFGTWVFLELRGLVGDWSSASGVGSFVEGRLLEYLIGFSAEMVLNMVNAAMWPFYWVSHGGYWMAGVVLAAAWSVSRLAAHLSPAPGLEA